MTIAEESPSWSPENGFTNPKIDAFRQIFLTRDSSGEYVSFDYGRLRDVRGECERAGLYQVDFLDNYPMRSKLLFPMNRLAMTFEGEVVDEEKQQPTVAEALQNNEEGQLGASIQIIQYFLQPFLMETPTLYLLLLAGPKPKYISSIEVLKLYFSVVHMIQASKLPFCDDEVFKSALECREYELEQMINFVQGHLFRTCEYQNIFGTHDATAVSGLHLFMIQYTLRTIMVIERFLIRIFAGRYTTENLVLLSTGRVCIELGEDQRKYLKESVDFWISEYESVFNRIPVFQLGHQSFPGNLPSRESLLEKISSSDNFGEWFSVYGFWFMMATQYI